MQFGVCASPEDAAWIKAAGADFLEANVQAVLAPMDAARRPPDPAALVLPIAAYNFFLPADLRVTGPDVDAARLATYADRACRRARASGASVIVFGSGAARKVPDGWPRARAEEQLVEAMRLAGRAAAAAGIIIAMEPLCRAETNVLNSISEGLALLDRARAPGLAILCDLYHLAAEQEPLADLDAAAGRLAHVHVGEPVGRGPPRPGGTACRDFFAKLKAIGYDSRVSLECGWTDMRKELAPALEFLRQEWRAAPAAQRKETP
jgi:sugar phosphate isomerase/epimerase